MPDANTLRAQVPILRLCGIRGFLEFICVPIRAKWLKLDGQSKLLGQTHQVLCSLIIVVALCTAAFVLVLSYLALLPTTGS